MTPVQRARVNAETEKRRQEILCGNEDTVNSRDRKRAKRREEKAHADANIKTEVRAALIATGRLPTCSESQDALMRIARSPCELLSVPWINIKAALNAHRNRRRDVRHIADVLCKETLNKFSKVHLPDVLKLLPDGVVNEVNTVKCFTALPPLSKNSFNLLWLPDGVPTLAKTIAGAEPSDRHAQSVQAAAVKLWGDMHAATIHRQCAPLGKVHALGSKCFQEGHHICSGNGLVVWMAVHNWEANAKLTFPAGPFREQLGGRS